MWDLRKNLGKYFSINMDSFKFVEDTRYKFKPGMGTAKYQIGIDIKSQRQFNRVANKLQQFMKKKHYCKKRSDGLKCKVNNDWEKFGQKEGVYNILYPQEFVGPDVYVINHGVQERLLLEPSIMTKNVLNPLVNQIGKQYGVKLSKKKKNNNKNNVVSRTKICSKYKNKSVRKTPTNWAYKKCMKQPIENIDTCKTLPPSGWNMYRYFCE